MIKRILQTIPLLFLCNIVFAQIGGIKVHVADSITAQPVSFAKVVLEMNDELLSGTWTDIYGNAVLKPLDTGVYYLIVISEGYDYGVKGNIKVSEDSVPSVKIAMQKTNELIVYFPCKYVPDKPKDKCVVSNAPGTFAVAGSCWASGNFDRVDISRLPSNDISYVQDFFPHR